MKILIDAGPIIAIFDRDDPWNARVGKYFDTFRGELITTHPVITEAAYALGRNLEVRREFYEQLAAGIYHLEVLTPLDFARIVELDVKYADQEADLADLSLIAISERLRIAEILTVDRRDFDIYRRFKKDPFNQIELPMV